MALSNGGEEFVCEKCEVVVPESRAARHHSPFARPSCWTCGGELLTMRQFERKKEEERNAELEARLKRAVEALVENGETISKLRDQLCTVHRQSAQYLEELSGLQHQLSLRPPA